MIPLDGTAPRGWGEGSSDPWTFEVPGRLSNASETVKKCWIPRGSRSMRSRAAEGDCFRARRSKLAGVSANRRRSRSHADFMGQFEVDLNECLDGKVKRLWRTLQPRAEKDEVSGDVELVLQWRYNARLDFCPIR